MHMFILDWLKKAEHTVWFCHFVNFIFSINYGNKNSKACKKVSEKSFHFASLTLKNLKIKENKLFWDYLESV